MANEWRGPPEWTRKQIERWNDINQSSNNPELAADSFVQIMYDIAFNTPRGEITGDLRASTIDSLSEYLKNQYNINLAMVFDWASWREEYAEG